MKFKNVLIGEIDIYILIAVMKMKKYKGMNSERSRIIAGPIDIQTTQTGMV